MSKGAKISCVQRDIENGEYDAVSYLIDDIGDSIPTIIDWVESLSIFRGFIPEEYFEEYINEDFLIQLGMWKASGEPVENYFESQEEYERLLNDFREKWLPIAYLGVPRQTNIRVLEMKGRRWAWLQRDIRNKDLGSKFSWYKKQ